MSAHENSVREHVIDFFQKLINEAAGDEKDMLIAVKIEEEGNLFSRYPREKEEAEKLCSRIKYLLPIGAKVEVFSTKDGYFIRFLSPTNDYKKCLTLMTDYLNEHYPFLDSEGNLISSWGAEPLRVRGGRVKFTISGGKRSRPDDVRVPAKEELLRAHREMAFKLSDRMKNELGMPIMVKREDYETSHYIPGKFKEYSVVYEQSLPEVAFLSEVQQRLDDVEHPDPFFEKKTFSSEIEEDMMEFIISKLQADTTPAGLITCALLLDGHIPSTTTRFDSVEDPKYKAYMEERTLRAVDFYEEALKKPESKPYVEFMLYQTKLGTGFESVKKRIEDLNIRAPEAYSTTISSFKHNTAEGPSGDRDETLSSRVTKMAADVEAANVEEENKESMKERISQAKTVDPTTPRSEGALAKSKGSK